MTKPMFVEPHNVCRVRHALTLSQDSEVSQEHAHDCDVSVILARYQRGGVLPPGRGPGAFEDVSGLCGADYADVIAAVKDSQEAVKAAKRAEAQALAKVKEFEAKPPAATAAPAAS